MTLLAGIGLCFPALAQDKPAGGLVHVKVIKVVDGDSTVIERDIDESQLHTIEKELSDVSGKEVKVMMFVDKKDGDITLPPGCRMFAPGDSSVCERMKKFVISGDSMKMMGAHKFLMMHDSTAGNMMFDMHLGSEPFMMPLPPPGENGEIRTGYMYNIENDNGQQRVIVKSFGPGDSSQVVIKKFEGKPGQEFTEDVVITAPNGTATHKVIVRTTVKIEDVEKTPKKEKAPKKEKSELKTEGLNFYPNPSDGRFTLDFEVEGKQPVIIRITDINGREVYKEEVKGEGRHSRPIDISSESKGTYILNLQQGKKSKSKKIVIE